MYLLFCRNLSSSQLKLILWIYRQVNGKNVSILSVFALMKLQVRPSRRRIRAEPHLQCRYEINQHSRLNINMLLYTLQTKHVCQRSNAVNRRRSDSKTRLIKYTSMCNNTVTRLTQELISIWPGRFRPADGGCQVL